MLFSWSLLPQLFSLWLSWPHGPHGRSRRYSDTRRKLPGRGLPGLPPLVLLPILSSFLFTSFFYFHYQLTIRAGNHTSAVIPILTYGKRLSFTLSPRDDILNERCYGIGRNT